MKVEIRLYATLNKYAPRGSQVNHIEIEDGKKLKDLIKDLGIPEEQIKLIFINGIHASGDEILKDGDRIGIFPPIAGG